MPTPVHQEKWKEYESILNVRANVGIFISILNNVLWELTGTGRLKLSREYLESG